MLKRVIILLGFFFVTGKKLSHNAHPSDVNDITPKLDAEPWGDCIAGSLVMGDEDNVEFLFLNFLDSLRL